MKKEVKEIGKKNKEVDAKKNENWQKSYLRQPRQAIYLVGERNPYGFRKKDHEIHLN